MPHDTQLLRALIPERWVILKVPLRPYCLGHLTILNKINSPLIGDDASKITGASLFLAVAICSMTWEDGQEFILEPAFVEREIKRLARLNRKTDIIEAATFFTKYLAEGSDIPGYMMEEEGGAQCWTPWEQRMRVRLMAGLHLTESQVMNRPLALNWWDYLTLEEQAGNLRISTQEEQAHVAAMVERANHAASCGSQN